MNRNQFFYKRQGVEFPEGIEPFEVTDAFNIDRVVKLHMYAPNSYVVVLDDMHEQIMERKVPVGKNGQVKVEKQKEVVCSEIFLSEEDSKRFRDLTEANEFGLYKAGIDPYKSNSAAEPASVTVERKKLSETTSEPVISTTIDK